jgi:multidrug transporter EmrE-like cation transporter
MYPGATVELSRVVVKERLSVHQLGGLSLALTGVALMAAG